MHVTIERKEETRGLIFKETWYCVYCTIVFSEEEKAVIHKAKLGDKWAMVYKMEFPPSSGVIVEHGPEFRNLFKKPHLRCFKSISEANDWEKELRERQLPAMKRVIENEQGQKTSGPSSFEL